MNPLEDLYRTRTRRERNGTLLDQWNHVLLHRDLERFISEGLVERVTNIREISPDRREKTWYQELATGNLYVYVAPEARSGPEFLATYGVGSEWQVAYSPVATFRDNDRQSVQNSKIWLESGT
jgi:hypothetical protein